jgi:hypothetical protein
MKMVEEAIPVKNESKLVKRLRAEIADLHALLQHLKIFQLDSICAATSCGTSRGEPLCGPRGTL